MKLHAKVSCTQCDHYSSCPQKTRMLVNYCGSKSKEIEKAILEAIADCHARKGHVLRHHPGAHRRHIVFHLKAA